MSMKIGNNSIDFVNFTSSKIKAKQDLTIGNKPSITSKDSLAINKKTPSEAFENNTDLILDERANLTLKNPMAVEKLPDFTKTPLKIGIVVAKKQGTLTIPSGTLYVQTASGRQDVGTFENATITIKKENNKLALYDEKGKALGIYDGTLKLEGNLSPAAINGKKYRGEVEVFANPADESTLNIVNDVMVEDYLKGVVPSESSASWPEESLKAQTLAARTYALSNWKRRDSLGFDLMATTSDQVYNGMGAEQASTNKAIEETSGQVILFNGKPINALFFSCSGGYTDSAKEVWKENGMPYIQPAIDYDQKAPRYKWTQNFSNNDVQKALSKLKIDGGKIKSIEIVEKTEHNRATKLKVVGSKGEFFVDANKFRIAIGLNSTAFTVKEQTSLSKKLFKASAEPTGFSFDGGGWGHGLGMSQWGARQMAEDGKSYDEILKHYYSGVIIDKLPTPTP